MSYISLISAKTTSRNHDLVTAGVIADYVTLMSEQGGFAENRVSQATILDLDASTKNGIDYYLIRILTRTGKYAKMVQ